MSGILTRITFAFAVIWTAGAAVDSAAAEKVKWKRDFIAEYTSDHGESLPEFLKRVGIALHEFTRSTGWEGCGAIGKRGDYYSVRLYSDHVPHGCAVYPSELADGFEFSGETIHSHPWQQVLVMTPAARAWSEFYKDGNASALTIRNDGANGFSKLDRKNGGWLIARRQLMRLEGGKTVNYGYLPTSK